MSLGAVCSTIQERADVGVQYEAHLLAVDPDAERIQRVMRATSWPEPIRQSEEVFLVDRVQQLGHCPLDNLILKRSHTPVELHSWPTNLWDRLR